MIPRAIRVAALRTGVLAGIVGATTWAISRLAVGPDQAVVLGRSAVGVTFVLTAAYACSRAARTAAVDAPSWVLLGAGLGVFCLSAVTFAVAQVLDLAENWLTAAAVFGLTFRLLAALAMLSFPVPATSTRSRWRARLDLVVVALIVAYLAWGWVLGGLVDAATSSLPAARSAMFCLLDIVLVIIVLMASLRRPPGVRDAGRLVGAGLLLLAVTDWSVGATLSSGSAGPSTFAALCSVGSLSLIAAGAWLTVHPSGIERRAVMNDRRRDLLPILLASIALVATLATDHDLSSDPLLLGLAISSAVALLAWQVAVVLESEETMRSLAEQGQRFRTLVDTAPIAIVETTRHGTVRVANAEAAQFLGGQAHDLVGARPDVRPLDSEFGSEALTSRVLDGETIRDLRVPLRRGDGEVLEMLVSAAPIVDRSGTTASIVWIGSDDTPRLRELAAMIDVQRMRAFEQLTSGIAHDFNNRLTVILGMAEILQVEAADEEQHEMLQTILDAGRRAATLVDQLVSTTRRKFDEQERLDLRTLLAGLEPDLRRRLPSGATLHLELGYATLPVEADWSDLEQAITNLVTNAYEALGSGGVVTLRARRGVDGDGRTLVEAVVADDGHGMEPGVQARVLEPFYTTKDGTGRSRGLGLPAVQGVVLRSRGELSIDSTVGTGTTVTVRLPLCDEDATVSGPDPAKLARRAGPDSATILLVDDEAEVRTVARRVLTSAGHVVIEASDANEAMAVLASAGAEVDLLLSDVVMPGRSGIELAEDFVARYPQRPVLLLSGNVGDTRDGGRAADVPFPLLSKPVAGPDLVAAVAGALAATATAAPGLHGSITWPPASSTP